MTCYCDPPGSFSDSYCWECKSARMQPFKEMGLSTRAANLLVNSRCGSVEDFLKKFTPKDVLAQPNMGRHTCNEFKEFARKHGIKWGDPIRMVIYQNGQADEISYSNWAAVGGKIGNLVGDVESFAVFENDRRVLFYHVDGIY